MLIKKDLDLVYCIDQSPEIDILCHLYNIFLTMIQKGDQRCLGAKL